MAASRSPSPERRSSGSDSPSAPGEYLAEFLAAIMRRQYAQALAYCRLILRYEPHNATARGFYPLLQRKLAAAAAAAAGSSASGSSSSSSRSALDSASGSEEERWSPELRWEGSSSSASERSADHNGNQPAAAPAPPPAPAQDEPDDENDNLPLDADPLHSSHSKMGAAALARLRAHFACST